MTLSTSQMREHLRGFAFRPLFIDTLGWNNYNQRISPYRIEETLYSFTPIAEQGGMIVVQCESSDGNIPLTGARREIHKYISDMVHENFIIFVDKEKSTSLWMWVKREEGKPRVRDHTYRRDQSGDALLQRLAGIAFSIEELDQEGKVSIATVTGRVQQAFDVERVTRRFYDYFKDEHANFLKQLEGVEGDDDRDWYASVMLNRLMFLYFIQSKGFLNGDYDYLRTKLAESQARGVDLYYGGFLSTLFFEGLALDAEGRSQGVNDLLGNIPYLNGGLFLPHAIEDKYGDRINISDAAFERLFDFFSQYQWHLDDRPLHAGNEINPDVLGYIFEKYVNQKQMGAYYTKEDITGYICTYAILPFLFEKVGLDVRAVMTDVKPYIYEAVSTEEYLPTETEREYAVRHNRYQSIIDDFAAGKIGSVNDLITYNLNIRALAEDWLLVLDDPLTVRRFYFDCLTKLTVLDPTCGSGAFLFAAMNILEALYELCIDRMQHFVKDAAVAFKYKDFVQELERISKHPNRRYFVFKSIIINNLYGVDIMEEAVEIAKLRLFLKLAAQVEDVNTIEPLPDIDFNIRAGNTLVGFATQHEIGGRLFATEDLLRKVEDADRALENFRALQIRLDIRPSQMQQAKADTKAKLAGIRDELDRALMQEYGQRDLEKFRRTHRPFHWYVEFNHVMANNGFDVIVGNPPYVEYRQIREYSIRNYETESCGNLYAYMVERCWVIGSSNSRAGMIVPVSAVSSKRALPLQRRLQTFRIWYSTYSNRPAKLFDGVEQRLAIMLWQLSDRPDLYSTPYNHWYSEEREYLLFRLHYTQYTKETEHISLGKVGSEIHRNILSKLFDKRPSIGAFQIRTSKAPVFFHDGPTYWIRAMSFEPNIDTSRSNHYKRFEAKDTALQQIVACVLNSTTYYLYFKTFSNCRDFSARELESFPLGTLSLDLAERMVELAEKLTSSYLDNVRRGQRLYPSGTVNYDIYYPVLSKPIIDEIDKVLAEHYGFTNEELDFIINYDIKYRIGQGGDETEGED